MNSMKRIPLVVEGITHSIVQIIKKRGSHIDKEKTHWLYINHKWMWSVSGIIYRPEMDEQFAHESVKT